MSMCMEIGNVLVKMRSIFKLKKLCESYFWIISIFEF